MSNPFERYDIDPMQGPAAITERMRELAEDADEPEREELRAVWEELTMHPRRRLQLALNAFPETRADVGDVAPSEPIPCVTADRPLTLRELAVVPRVADVLTTADGPSLPDLLPPIESDPFIDLPERSK
jgi:hypothetical protein